MSQALAVRSQAELEGWSDRKLDAAIKKGVSLAGSHKSSYEEFARLSGLLLIEKKRRLGHGKWLPWVNSEAFAGSHDQASVYMKMAANFGLERTLPPAQEPVETTEEAKEKRAQTLRESREVEDRVAEVWERIEREPPPKPIDPLQGLQPDTERGNAARKAQGLMRKAIATEGGESASFFTKASEIVRKHTLEVVVIGE